jgi:hypothetical protein
MLMSTHTARGLALLEGARRQIEQGMRDAPGSAACLAGYQEMLESKIWSPQLLELTFLRIERHMGNVGLNPAINPLDFRRVE